MTDSAGLFLNPGGGVRGGLQQLQMLDLGCEHLQQGPTWQGRSKATTQRDAVSAQIPSIRGSLRCTLLLRVDKTFSGRQQKIGEELP